MKPYTDMILAAQEAGDVRLANQMTQKALDASQSLINLAIETVHPKDRPFLLAAMKASIAPMEQAVGTSGVELANAIVNHTVAVLVPRGGG